MMKIAVTYENGNVFPHFGHTEQFKVYEIEEGKISRAQVRKPHWQKRESIFMAGYLAVRMRLWRRCFWVNLHLIRMFIVTIMGKDIITEMDIVGKTSMAVQEMVADAN